MTTYIYAHTWDRIGDERIPRWPSKIGEPRPIKVEIFTWKGTSPGAKHYDVTVKEENNQWWCEERNAWVELSCDSESRGYSMEASVLKVEEAVDIAKSFLKLILGKLPTKKSAEVDVSWNGPNRPSWCERG